MEDYRNPCLTQREGVAVVMQSTADMNQRDGLVDCLAGDTVVGEQGVTVAKAQHHSLQNPLQFWFHFYCSSIDLHNTDQKLDVESSDTWNLL